MLEMIMAYCSRTYNMFHVKQGSKLSAISRLRGREGQSPKTLPFGVLALGSPATRAVVNESERLTPVMYFGPCHSFGGGSFGILAREGRIGVPDEDLLKVRKYKACRVVSPCEWPKEELLTFCSVLEGVPDAVPAPPISPEGESVSDAPPGRSVANPPGTIVPASGPPKQWISEHGFTPNCGACNHQRTTGKAHGKVHSRACKDRYKAWLEGQREKRSCRETEGEEEEDKRRRREGAVDVSVPPSLGDAVPPPVLSSGPSSGSGLAPQVLVSLVVMSLSRFPWKYRSSG